MPADRDDAAYTGAGVRKPRTKLTSTELHKLPGGATKTAQAASGLISTA
jgi:hypothetical protein